MMGDQADSRIFSFYLGAIHELGSALAKSSQHKVESSRPLRESLYRLMGTFTIGRGAILLWDQEGRRLAPAVTKGFRASRAFQFPLGPKQARQLVSASKPYHPHMPPAELAHLAEKMAPTLDKTRIQWVVPLATGRALVGMLLIGPCVNGRKLTSLELEVLEEMAMVLALRIEDDRVRHKLAAQVRQLQRFNRQLKQIYLETLRTLAIVIDGPEETQPSHSVRVASLSVEIARNLKLDRDTQDRLYLAALLHDIGKRIICEQILDKPDSFDETERTQMQNHVKHSCDLISHLRFPWGDVAEIIRHHHERLDGLGYPDALKGAEISLEAKILMLSEAFDAMTSNRPWRPRLGFDKVIEQIQKNLGLQFEPRVVQALCEVVEAGLKGDVVDSDFVPHLKNSFDPGLIRQLMCELRNQLTSPTFRPPAIILDVMPPGGKASAER